MDSRAAYKFDDSSSFSSSATDDDLPGPGRLLGNAYMRSGVVLERLLRKLPWKPPVPPEEDGASTLYFTNATADNLPGPGRLLGKAYMYLGLRLQQALGTVAHRAGLGPAAAYERIVFRLSRASEGELRLDARSKKVLMRQRKDCARLVKYLRSHVPSVKQQALLFAMQLAVLYPDLQPVFRDRGAVHTLDGMLSDLTALRASLQLHDQDRLFVSNHMGLFVATQRVLSCVEDSELNCLAKDAIAIQRNELIASPLGYTFTGMIMRMLKYLRNADVSFLALRYLHRCLADFVRFRTSLFRAGMLLSEAVSMYDIVVDVLMKECLFMTVERDILQDVIRQVLVVVDQESVKKSTAMTEASSYLEEEFVKRSYLFG